MAAPDMRLRSQPVDYPAARTCPLHPAPVLRDLRDRDPVAKVRLWTGREAWLVTRYDDARAILRDDERFSADASNPAFPSTNPGQRFPLQRPGFSRIDDPRHQEIRNLIADRFTVREAAKLAPVVQRIVDEQTASLTSGPSPSDFVSEFALAVPSRMIAYVLGLPHEELAVFLEAVHRFGSRSDAAHQGLLDMREFVDGLVRRKASNPGDDLMALLFEHRRTGRLSADELVDLTVLLLVAGHTTTTGTMGLGLISLLSDRALYDAIRTDEAAVARLVDEVIRYHTVLSDGLPRVAKVDLTFRGQQIREGDPVIVSVASANRDERRYSDPDTLEPSRRNARSQLGFGHGGHVCLGQHLARLELRIAYTTLARRVPTLRLAAPIDTLPFRHDMMLYGVHELPVTW